MARDSSRTAKRRGSGRNAAARRGDNPGSWISFLSGLALGLTVAFGVFLYRQPTSPGPGSAAPQPEVVNPPHLVEPGSSAPEPEIEFYYRLPEMEVTVPEWDVSQNSAANENKLDPGTYVLQVGSFKKYDDAEAAKAKLALQGIRANVQRVVINGQDVWYRVHVGPFTNAQAIDEMRLQLIEAGNDFIMLRIGENEGA